MAHIAGSIMNQQVCVAPCVRTVPLARACAFNPRLSLSLRQQAGAVPSRTTTFAASPALPLRSPFPCPPSSRIPSSPRAPTSASTATPAASTATARRSIADLSRDVGHADTVVLWFRNDLRVDDHPGLTAAAAAGPRALVPLYVIDPERLSYLAFTPGGPEVLSAALHRLRAELRALGSDLVVRAGPWGGALAGAAAAAGAAAVVSEEEVELRWRQPAQDALDGLSASASVASYGWDAPLWPPAAFQPRYRDWAAARGQPAPPLPPPAALPPLPAGLEAGAIPSGDELRELLAEAALASYGSGAAAEGLRRVAGGVLAACASGPAAARAVRVAAGPHAPLELLRQYIKAVPPPPPPPPGSPLVSLDDEVAALAAPGVAGAPFTGLFGAAKALGTLSPRRVYAEAFAAAGRPYGSAPPRRLSPPEAAAAGMGAEAADFHRALAVLDDSRTVAPGVEVHFWRWQGGLTDYCVAEPANPLPGAPTLLLVHGFGAFGDQWRGNMPALAAAGYRVLAPTFPGFGRSQKAAVPYSQDLWRDFLRDFVLQVARSPVVVVGNSIGGFISACLAADYPDLVRGLVLTNSAGPVDASFSIDSWRAAVAAGRRPPPAVIVSAVSSALFWYLERTVPSTLRWLYPTNPAKADEWLAAEILRAAGDSGALDVFKAVWYLPPPRALNWLVAEAWRGPTLVLQGALDPLNDARGRARQLEQLCPNAAVTLLEAGHCPHDEQPEAFNEGLLAWLRGQGMGAGAPEREAAVQLSAGGAVRAPSS